MATGSFDHTVRIWDLRKKRLFYTLPAHSNLISQVKFQPNHSHFLVTSSYDTTCKVWNTYDWKLVKTLAGHQNKVMSVDASADGKYFVSTSYDRTWKLWAREDDYKRKK